MTRHFFTTELEGQALSVEVGYDRPCQHFFLNVYAPEREDEDEQLIYTSTYDVRWFKPERGHLYGGLSMDELRQVFGELLITPPAGLTQALLDDQRQQRGNHVRSWDTPAHSA